MCECLLDSKSEDNKEENMSANFEVKLTNKEAEAE